MDVIHLWGIIPMDKFKILLEVRMEHAYYGEGRSPIGLVPSGETKRFFEQWRMIWKQQGANRWILVGEMLREALPQRELVFGISPLEKQFYYVSGGVRENERVRMLPRQNIPGVWKWVAICPDWAFGQGAEQILEQQEAVIRVETVSRYFEYILIPRYHPAETEIRLREAQGKLEFGEGEPVALPGIVQAYRFCSREAVVLERGMLFRVQLWEERGEGERLISEYIPHPEPDSGSVLKAENVITTYFYY